MAKVKNNNAKNKNMNKGEFVSLIAQTGKISKVEAERAVNLFLECVSSTLKSGQGITIPGFGSYTVQKREAREGRNPKTGEKMKINAYKQPVFKAGSKLKEGCN